MQRIDLTKIREEPIHDPCGDMLCEDCHIGGCPASKEGIIDDESWKDTYLQKLRESRETGKPLSEITNADPEWMESHRLDYSYHKKSEGI